MREVRAQSCCIQVLQLLWQLSLMQDTHIYACVDLALCPRYGTYYHMYLAGGTNYKAVIGARPNGEQQNF